jgi:hypothetical protein
MHAADGPGATTHWAGPQRLRETDCSTQLLLLLLPLPLLLLPLLWNWPKWALGLACGPFRRHKAAPPCSAAGSLPPRVQWAAGQPLL